MIVAVTVFYGIIYLGFSIRCYSCQWIIAAIGGQIPIFEYPNGFHGVLDSCCIHKRGF